MHHSPCLRTVLCLLGTTGAALAAAQTIGDPPDGYAISNGNLSALVTGDFNGDGDVDAVVLDDGKPVLNATIELFSTYLSANTAGSDIALLAGTGAGGRDRLVLAGAGGLRLLDFDTSTGWTVSTLRDATTLWNGATVVRVGSFLGDARADIVAATPTKLLLLGSSSGANWDLEIQLPLTLPATGLAPVEWDGDASGLDEIAVFSSAGVAVVKSNGTWLNNSLWGAGPILAVALSEPGATREALVMVASNANGNQWLRTMRRNADGTLGLSTPWALGSLGVVSLAVGEWNDDATQDVVMNVRSATEAVVYLQAPAGSSPQFNPSDPLRVVHLTVGHSGRNANLQDTGISLADIDHDTDLDVVMAIQGSYIGGSWAIDDARFSAVELGRNDRVDHGAYQPRVHWSQQVNPSQFDPSYNRDTGEFEVWLERPATVLPSAELQYRVWRTAGPKMELTAAALTETQWLPLTSSGLVGPIAFDTNLSGPEFPDRFTVIVRQVVRDGSGNVTERKPAFITTLAMVGRFDPTPQLHEGATWTELYTVSGAHIFDMHIPDDPGGTSSGPRPPPPPPAQDPSGL